MTTSYTKEIQQLYVAYLNRPADPADLVRWNKLVESQAGNTAAVSAALAGSAEYKSNVAGKDAAAIVDMVFQGLFGRPPALAGLNFWGGLLSNGTLSADNIATHIAGGARGNDKLVYDNKVKAATAFTAALDNDWEIDTYTQTQPVAATKAFLATITSDAVLADALVPAKLANSVNAVLGIRPEVSLTAGPDALTGTDGNDVFSAHLQGGVGFQSLQSGDEINGGAGVRDMLNGTLGNNPGDAAAPILKVEVVELGALITGGGAAAAARLDASFSSSVREWVFVGGNTDLVLENVGLRTTAGIRDTTITMRDTNGGDVDFGVYFTPSALIGSISTDASQRVSSTIILDNVGRGGTGGDLVVGSMAAGGFSNGVEAFHIEVRDSSKLQTINSTNNALREVIIKNGVTTTHGDGTAGQGDLTVLGASAPAVAGTASAALPRSEAQHNSFGFSDVRVIDGSAMTGKLSFDAEITSAVLDKYPMSSLSRTFAYTGGGNDDSMHVTIDGNVLTGSTDGLSGLPPGNYVFNAFGGKGNDTITVAITDGLAGWADKQKSNHNVHVGGGEGNDTIHLGGGGAVGIGLGDGNDTLVLDAGWKGDARVADFNVASDKLDFAALGGRGAQFSGANVSNADKSITVQAASTSNDTLAEIAAMYADGLVAASHVFVTHNDNVGSVYSVVDTAAGGIAVTLVGSVSLGGASWAGLTGGNFA